MKMLVTNMRIQIRLIKNSTMRTEQSVILYFLILRFCLIFLCFEMIFSIPTIANGDI